MRTDALKHLDFVGDIIQPKMIKRVKHYLWIANYDAKLVMFSPTDLDEITAVVLT